MAAYESVIGLECHVELSTETKMFCGCRNEFGAAAEHERVPRVPRAPRVAPGAEREGDRVHRPDRPRAELRRSRPTPCSTGRTTSIPTCRRTTRSASTTCRSASAGHLEVEVDGSPTPDRHHPRAHGGGHRQDHTRGARPAGSARPTTRSSTTTAPASRSSRSSPSPTCARRKRRARTSTELRATLEALGGLGRADGGGVAPVRREHLDPRRPARTTFGTKVEIKNLNSIRSLERALRYEEERQRAALEARRAARAGDPALRRGDRDRRTRCARRRRRSTTATSPSPTCRRSRPSRRGSRSSEPRSPSSRRPGARGTSGLGLKPEQARILAAPATAARSSRRRSRSAPTRRRRRTGSRRTSPASRTRRRLELADAKVTPRHVADLSRLDRGGDDLARAPSRCSRRRSRRAMTLEAIVERRGLRQVTDVSALEVVGRRGDRREPRARRAVPQRQGGGAERAPSVR